MVIVRARAGGRVELTLPNGMTVAIGIVVLIYECVEFEVQFGVIFELGQV